jgi:hypothetical protein
MVIEVVPVMDQRICDCTIRQTWRRRSHRIHRRPREADRLPSDRDIGDRQNAEGEHDEVLHIGTFPTEAIVLHAGSGPVPLRHLHGVRGPLTDGGLIELVAGSVRDDQGTFYQTNAVGTLRVPGRTYSTTPAAGLATASW